MSTETKLCEYNSNNAFIFNGNNGTLNNNNKYNSNHVREVSDFHDDNYVSFDDFIASMREAYRLCLANKRGTTNALRFRVNDVRLLMDLSRRIYAMEYVPAPSISFIITSPCRREVIAADFSDRIVQHWVVMRLEPLFEEFSVIPDEMYSCRVGKGNLAALKAAREKIFEMSNRYREDCFVATFDLSSFFMSIDKRRLYDELVDLIQRKYVGDDKDILLYLVRVLTLTAPVEHAIRRSPASEWEPLPKHKSQYNLDWFLGLAIGNLWSQTDANFYNAPVVRWLLQIDNLAVVNYVDDFLLISKDRQTIHDAMMCVRQYLKDERGLAVHATKYYEQSYTKGVRFLGGVVKFDRLYVRNRTVGKLRCRIHYFNEAYLTHFQKVRHLERYVSILNSYFGLMAHFHSFAIRKRAAEEVLKCWKGYIQFPDDFSKAVAVEKYTQSALRIKRIKSRKRQMNNFIDQHYGHTGRDHKARDRAESAKKRHAPKRRPPKSLRENRKILREGLS